MTLSRSKYVLGAFASVLLGVAALTFPLHVRAAESVSVKKTKVEFPRLCGVAGGPAIVQNGTALKGKLASQRLQEKLLITTDETSRVCLEVDAGLKMSVFSKSSVFIPVIDRETGQVEEIELLRGKVLFEKNATSQNVRMTSALYREDLPTGKFVLEFDPEAANIRASVIEGELPFRGLETEVTSRLTGGETQAFLGEQQEGKIQYDTLLQGRQVARGQLGAKTKLAESDLKRLLSFFEIKTKKPVDSGLKLKPSKMGSLCKMPNATFNECLYRCQGNPRGEKTCDLSNPKVSCVRLRCLANGEWGDPFEFPKSKAPCEPQDLVKSCDY